MLVGFVVEVVFVVVVDVVVVVKYLVNWLKKVDVKVDVLQVKTIAMIAMKNETRSFMWSCERPFITFCLRAVRAVRMI